MDQKLKKRIERMEAQVGKHAQKVRVIVWPTDPLDCANEKLERWKAGEEVDGIDCGPYRGGKLDVIVIGFKRSPNSRSNGVKDPNMP